MNKILFIGLNGFAGSGKDTVAKALRLMLSYNWTSLEEFRITWETEAFRSLYATLGPVPEDETCYCIAFADQLKHICANMFGIPVEKFYYNKETSWINMTNYFEYTEQQPYKDDIMTAEEYYMVMNSNNIPKTIWMSLREVLVYIGTYVCQQAVSCNCFVNGVNNSIKYLSARNKNLKYVICTDVRFYHELDWIKKMHGININIRRNTVKQLDNIAEHELDDEDSFDYVIHNDGTYDELLVELWNLVHNNVIFNNEVIQLKSHDSTKNYIRHIDDNKWECIFETPSCRVIHDNGNIIAIDPSGGPMIHIGDNIENAGIVKSIVYDDKFVIDVS